MLDQPPPTEQEHGADPALTVSELNGMIKRSVSANPDFAQLTVQGQVSGSKGYASGHHYFSLVDPTCSIKCILFRGRKGQEFLEDGAQVLIYGKLDFYDVRGQISFIADEVKPYGLGAMQKEFEALKAKLTAEGLFAPERKRPLPRFPRRIAVVTSPSGAAIQDVIRALKRRYPIAELITIPVTVQGEAAEPTIISGIAALDKLMPDVCLLVRGGGSPEDLWAFNSESLARAIFAAAVPIVTGIGHEVDITIADMVADHRAATPTAAAEIATPDQDELRENLEHHSRALSSALTRLLRQHAERLAFAADRLQRAVNTAPARQRTDDLARRAATAQANLLASRRQHLNASIPRMRTGIAHAMTLLNARLNERTSILNSLSPYGVLKRGYSVARLKDGKILTNAAQAAVGDNIELQLHSGALDAQATRIRPADSAANAKE